MRELSSGSVSGYDFTVSGLYMTATCPTGVQAHPTAVPVAEDLTTDWWNAAGPLEPIRPHISAIDTVGDTDWFYFYTSATGEVKIGMNRTSGKTTANLICTAGTGASSCTSETRTTS